MKYSPKKFDTGIRAIYSTSLVLSFILMMVPVKGATSSVLSSIALILLGVSVMLFIKYDATSYEYILLERNGTFDFYVNKISGRRGAYVCYFPISDCVCHGAFTDTTRSELNAKYNDCSFSKYVQNFMTGKRYFALFAHEGRHQCVVFEANEEMIRLFENFAGKRVIDGEIQVQEVENE
jgi:hypothetical protein